MKYVAFCETMVFKNYLSLLIMPVIFLIIYKIEVLKVILVFLIKKYKE